MASQPSAMQRRVIATLVRRNIQGWGRPRDYTQQRLRLGGMILGVAVIAAAIDGVIRLGNATNSAVNALLVFLGFVVALGAILGISFLASSLPAYLRSTQPTLTYTGTVEAAITRPSDAGPYRDDYAFITLRLPDGKLKAFALATERCGNVCAKGQQVRLIVQPGTEFVMQADAF